jgi:uncharacterized integral membrane protein
MQALRTLAFLLVVLLIVAIGLLLGIDNSVDVELAFLDWRSPSLPLFVWMCLALAAGVALGFLLASLGGLRHRLARRSAERELDARRREVEDLRQLSVED